MNEVIILIGVTGCGKTTIGLKLSKKLGVPFHDADDFHPKANISKMENGMPLDDADRAPWLETLANYIHQWNKSNGAVLACSALKESYRSILGSKTVNLRWVYLHIDEKTVKRRVRERKGHFMPESLIHSQFETLEAPTYGIKVDASRSPDLIVDDILFKLE